MKMSYRQAWQMVTDMNGFSKEPIVGITSGGKGGGGATVTPYGLLLLQTYRTMEQQLDDAAARLLAAAWASLPDHSNEKP